MNHNYITYLFILFSISFHNLFLFLINFSLSLALAVADSLGHPLFPLLLLSVTGSICLFPRINEFFNDLKWFLFIWILENFSNIKKILQNFWYTLCISLGLAGRLMYLWSQFSASDSSAVPCQKTKSFWTLLQRASTTSFTERRVVIKSLVFVSEFMSINDLSMQVLRLLKRFSILA